MSKIKDKKVPQLRFPEFNDEWRKQKVKEMLQRYSKPVSVDADKLYQQIGIRSHGKGIFHKELVDGDTLGRKRVFWVKEDALVVNIVFAWEQAIAKTSEKEKGMIASHRFPMYLPLDGKVDVDFLLKFFLTPKGKSLLELASPGGAGRNKTLGQQEFEKLSFEVPNFEEQRKIASFFTAVDQKIIQLKQKKALLEQYKKGVMQRLFSQQLRFKAKDGEMFPDWETVSLKEIANRITRKNKEANSNVLTISGQHGLVSQLGYFSKTVAAKDLSGYYLMEEDDFAYNKSYSNGYPMGAIKRLAKYEKGVVSTLYICFRFKENISLPFMEQYFENGNQNAELEKVAQEGARNHGLLNIGVNDFFNIKLTLPCFDEQQRIADFLSAIDKKIVHVQSQIEKTEKWKKGLLQKMFC